MIFLRAAGNAFAVASAAGVLALEIAGTSQPPVLAILAPAVIVPEMAPVFFVVALLGAFAAGRFAGPRVRALAVGCATLAALLALVPLAEYPAARAAADDALRAAIGNGGRRPAEATYAFDILADRRVRLRDGATLGLDVYRPAARGARPTIVTIYGGAWLFGKRGDTARIDAAYAARGYTVVAIDYRHAPRHRFPTQRDDVRDALAAIARNAAAWHVDRDRVAMFGRSAGAELALLAAYEPGPLHVRAAVAYYSPTDLIAGYETPPRPDPANVRAILRAYLGAPPQQRRAAYRDASPIAHVRAGLPPTLLIVGLHDSLITPEMQRGLRDALRAHGDRVAAVELPWSNHAFDEVPGGLGAGIAEPLTRAFLAATLDPGPAVGLR
ncbi:MAG: hypothetical protein NVSMB19_22770 [Vulcanimicrobiaceae bacterium]